MPEPYCTPRPSTRAMPPKFASSRRPSFVRAAIGVARDRKDILLSMHAIAGAYRRVLRNGLVIASARAEHAAQLESLQRVVFPTLADEERFKTAHYLKHFDLFPAGQFVGLDGDRVVAATATIRLHFDFSDRSHTFADIIQGGWLTSHEPDGDWLYGADVGVHPDYRGKRLALGLYAARQELVWA